MVSTKLSGDVGSSQHVGTPLPQTLGVCGADGDIVEGLVVLNSNGRVTYCNGPASHFLGIPPLEALGRPLKELPCFRKSRFDSPQALEVLLRAIGALVEPPVTVPLLLLQPQRRELSVTAFPIPVGPGERMTGLLMRDVSKEQQEGRQRNTLVSMACHELCSPITTIMGFTELLLRLDPAKEERQAWLEIIRRDAQRLAAMVTDLGAASGLQAGNLTVNLVRLSLPEAVEKVLAALRPTTNRHRFVLDIDSDIPEVIADGNKLAQVLVNLLENAVKYSPQGGVITVSAYHQPEQGRVVVSIADRGIGIAPEDQRCIFSPFQRIRRPETEGIKGTGLGLYIVKELVALMRGEIWLKSEVDRGSSFFFSLPTGRAQVND